MTYQLLSKASCLSAIVALLLATPAARSQRSDIKAVVTQAKGTKANVETSGQRSTNLQRIVEGTLILKGNLVRVPYGDKLGILCSSEHWIKLEGEAIWTLTADACAMGEELEPGTFLSLAPLGRGRLLDLDGILVMENKVRAGTKEGLLLSPRGTAVRNTRPELIWLSRPLAVEYELDITGLAEPIRIGKEQVTCRRELAWDGEIACTFSWPEEHPGLSETRPTSIEIGYRENFAAGLEKDGGRRTRIEFLGAEQKSQIDQRLETFSRIAGGQQRALLKAGLFVRHGLYAEAIGAYRQALDLGGGPFARVALADIYFLVGLYKFSERHYQDVFQMGKDLPAEAAAKSGLGRLATRDRDYVKAQALFRESSNIYRELGLEGEVTAAEKAASEAASRIEQ